MYAAVSGTSVRMDVRNIGHGRDMMTIGLRAVTNGPRSPDLEVQNTMEAILGGYAKAR